MVLEPKFVDYGSFHPTADVPQLQQHNSSHALLSPRSVLSLPPLDDEEPPNTSKGTNMTQEKELLEERQRYKRRLSEENLSRKLVFENYAENITEIFDFPGIHFHTFRHNKIKFSFRPCELTKYVREKVTFYVSLKFECKFWRMKRDSLPTNYKWKVYKLFYRKKSFAVDDEKIFDVLKKIYEILVEWTKEHEEFRLEKFQRYKAGEDVELDSDDENIFLTASERVELYQRRVKILRRMIPPEQKIRPRRQRK